MREYLFKGKRLDNGEWIEGDLSQDRDLGKAYIHGYDYYTDECGLQREPFEFEVDPETVGQFTGMMDGDGKKTFEGDVLSYSNPKPFRDFIAVVSFNDGCFDLVNDSRDYRDYLKCHTCNYTGNVIGNRWDNPELLEGV